MSNIEIIQAGENEYCIGKNKTVFIDRKTIHITVVGVTTNEMALLHNELDRKLFSLAEGKVNYLIDLNKSGQHPSQARSLFKKLTYHDKVYKVAIYGLHSVARVLASFVIGMDIKEKQRFFKKEEQAREWLEE